MIGAVSYEFDNSTLQESYSSFQKLATQAQTGFNGSMAFVIQTFTKSAVQKSALKGGNHLGLKEVTQACKRTISLSTQTHLIDEF